MQPLPGDHLEQNTCKGEWLYLCKPGWTPTNSQAVTAQKSHCCCYIGEGSLDKSQGVIEEAIQDAVTWAM